MGHSIFGRDAKASGHVIIPNTLTAEAINLVKHRLYGKNKAFSVILGRSERVTSSYAQSEQDNKYGGWPESSRQARNGLCVSVFMSS